MNLVTWCGGDACPDCLPFRFRLRKLADFNILAQNMSMSYKTLCI